MVSCKGTVLVICMISQQYSRTQLFETQALKWHMSATGKKVAENVTNNAANTCKQAL